MYKFIILLFFIFAVVILLKIITKDKVLNFKYFIIISIASLLAFEGAIGLMLACPIFSRFGPKDLLQYIYMESYRNIIQLDSNFARYDPWLKYTLKPGSFFFHNSEFNNEFRVNSLGTRDNETSLSSPEIIVVGDSIPMGWGVDQNKTFAELVEKKTNLKVLNAAISSYSTVQAMRILDKIDTSKTRFLIIYYQHWKYPENLSYYLLRDKFKIIDQEKYEETVIQYNKKKRYFPMKYTILVYYFLKDRLSNYMVSTAMLTQGEVAAYPLEVKSLLYVIINASHLNLNNLKIIILCSEDFVVPLKTFATLKEYPAFYKKYNSNSNTRVAR